jgi:protein-L-isoaspartate O-methyltransferase
MPESCGTLLLPIFPVSTLFQKKNMSQQIPDDVLEVLQTCTCEGNNLTMPIMSRELYVKVNKVLAALGGKWNRKAGAHIFPEEAGPMIADVIAAGEYVDAKKLYQAYNTPPELAERLVSMIAFREGESAMEPSAGTGVIARELRKRGLEVTCVEIQQDLADELIMADFAVHWGDFLKVPVPTQGTGTDQSGTQTVDERYDVIAMNPPFTRGQDMDHIRRAYDLFLKPGGRMVALSSPGWQFRTDRKAKEFREWLGNLPFQVGNVDAGAFKAEGTMIRTVFLVLSKPKPITQVTAVTVAGNEETTWTTDIREVLGSSSVKDGVPQAQDDAEDPDFEDDFVEELATTFEQDEAEAETEALVAQASEVRDQLNDEDTVVYKDGDADPAERE